jgi:hypothetical protein
MADLTTLCLSLLFADIWRMRVKAASCRASPLLGAQNRQEIGKALFGDGSHPPRASKDAKLTTVTNGNPSAPQGCLWFMATSCGILDRGPNESWPKGVRFAASRPCEPPMQDTSPRMSRTRHDRSRLQKQIAQVSQDSFASVATSELAAGENLLDQVHLVRRGSQCRMMRPKRLCAALVHPCFSDCVAAASAGAGRRLSNNSPLV